VAKKKLLKQQFIEEIDIKKKANVFVKTEYSQGQTLSLYFSRAPNSIEKLKTLICRIHYNEIG
jgi:hypothetical protein